MIIIAIIAAIAIPSLLASRRAANESSAIGSLKTIHSSQATWYATSGGNTTYSADLATLGTAGLVDTLVAGGNKSGYTLATSAAAAAGDGSTPATFCATATPQGTGVTATGVRTFGVGLPGVIYGATAAPVPACAAGVFTVAGTAIQ